MTAIRVPYVDLAAQNRPLKAELLEAVGRVLDHGWLVNGPEVADLERRLAERLGGGHVVGVASGTAALVLALRLHGIGPGDEVVVPSHSFVATASAVVLAGARPVFADVDEETMVLDAAAAERAITERTRAVLPVHLNGFAADLDAFTALCRDRDLVLLEDCAQALGAAWKGRPVGTFGTGCFSLHPLKPLAAAGDAGFVWVSEAARPTTLKRLRNLGLADRDHLAQVSGNDRLDTVQAAMLGVKLGHLDAWLAARRAHAEAYRAALEGLVRLPPARPECQPSHSVFCVRHPRRDALLEGLRARGIDAKVHYPVAIHQQAPFAGDPPPSLPVTERVVREIVSLPVSPELDVAGREAVIAAVQETLAA